MKKINILIVLLMVIVFAAACSKGNSVNSLLIGKWAQVQTANDNNGNGKIDPGELETLNPVDTVIFKRRDTSLYIYSAASKIDTTIYTYHVDDKKLLLTLNGKQYILYIDSISSKYMILKDTGNFGGSISWTMYTKQ